MISMMIMLVILMIYNSRVAMVVFGSYWKLLKEIGSFWKPLEAIGSYGKLLEALGSFRFRKLLIGSFQKQVRRGTWRTDSGPCQYFKSFNADSLQRSQYFSAILRLIRTESVHRPFTKEADAVLCLVLRIGKGTTPAFSHCDLWSCIQTFDYI